MHTALDKKKLYPYVFSRVFVLYPWMKIQFYNEYIE